MIKDKTIEIEIKPTGTPKHNRVNPFIEFLDFAFILGGTISIFMLFHQAGIF